MNVLSVNRPHTIKRLKSWVSLNDSQRIDLKTKMSSHCMSFCRIHSLKAKSINNYNSFQNNRIKKYQHVSDVASAKNGKRLRTTAEWQTTGLPCRLLWSFWRQLVWRWQTEANLSMITCLPHTEWWLSGWPYCGRHIQRTHDELPVLTIIMSFTRSWKLDIRHTRASTKWQQISSVCTDLLRHVSKCKTEI